MTRASTEPSTSPAVSAAGLDDVVVAHTAVSHPDGSAGRLVIVGAQVDALAGTQSFEAVCCRLWALGGSTLDEARARELLGRARARAFADTGALRRSLAAPDAMTGLRTAIADVTEGDRSEPELAAELAGVLAVHTAARSRVARGGEPIAPDPSSEHARDLLRMATGEAASDERMRALDTYLVAVIDHGMNASTFTARTVASTGADAAAAAVAALAALSGPLHGGAPGPVLDMLDAVERRDDAEGWLRAELDAGRRIMGMGHRVYRVRDPRAAVLERAVERLERERGDAGRVRTARAVERAAEALLAERYPARALRANVEFYTAVLLDALGLHRSTFSAVFACSRVVGWLAHVHEQRRVGRLIRPRSCYAGASPG